MSRRSQNGPLLETHFPVRAEEAYLLLFQNGWVPSLPRGHSNLPCVFPTPVSVLPKWTLFQNIRLCQKQPKKLASSFLFPTLWGGMKPLTKVPLV